MANYARPSLNFLLLIVLAMSAQAAQAQVSGFGGTLNNYKVGMHAGCPQACSQWFFVHFRASTDGTVDAPISLENDTLRVFCGRIRITVRDRANPPGRILGVFDSAKYCIGGKGSDTNFRARVVDVPWSFQTSPDVGRLGADLYIVPIEYEDRGIDWEQVASSAFSETVRVVGPKVIQIGVSAIKSF